MLCIVGPGGVGGLLAALAGDGVAVVARPETADVLEKDGITVESAQFGSFHARPEVLRSVPDGADVILATKSYTLPDLDLGAPREVIALMNGVRHADEVAALSTRAVCGAIRVVSERTAPGQIRHYSPFTIIDLPESARDFAAVEILRDAGVEVRFRPSHAEVLWAKASFLAPFALLTAATGQPIGPAIEHADASALADEMAWLATEHGYAITGQKIMDHLASIDPSNTSSLARDVHGGHTSEIDVLGDDLVERGATLGRDLPVMASLVEKIHELEMKNE